LKCKRLRTNALDRQLRELIVNKYSIDTIYAESDVVVLGDLRPWVFALLLVTTCVLSSVTVLAALPWTGDRQGSHSLC